MNVGVIGLGYWGPNLVRNILATHGIEGVSAADVNDERLQKLARRFPSVALTADYHELLLSDEIEAIAIATPVSTHYALAKAALEYGKHVLLEKPMTASVAEAEELVELSEKKGLTLMVDHTFVFTGAVRKIKELIANGVIGQLYYFDSVRVNLGLFQHDVNVILDLAPHDISIMEHVVQKKPVSVSAFGSAHYNGKEDVAYIVVNFDNGFIAHFHVNWLAPVKVRRILIGGDKKMVVYDDVEPSEKVKVYDKGVEITTKEGVYQTLVQYRTGDMSAPKLDASEALSLVCEHFKECIELKRTPISDGLAGLNVVRVLSAAEQSLKSNGRPVRLN